MNIGNFNDPLLGGWIKGCLYYFKIAVALAVAAIPEGLPAVITTCLALGSRRMTKNNAIIKKLPSVETLGCTTVICSDKTGTLTLNRMVATEFTLFGTGKSNLVVSTVDTDAYSPLSNITDKDMTSNISSYKNIPEFIRSILLNTTCRIEYVEGEYKAMGASTEAALITLAAKFGKHYGSKNEGYIDEIRGNWESKMVLGFDSRRKVMSTLARENGKNENSMYVKGAPERVIKSATKVLLRDGTECEIQDSDRNKFEDHIKAVASKGLRVLAIAKRSEIGTLKTFNGISDKQHVDIEKLKDPSRYGELEDNLTLIGFVGIKDPVRPEVAPSIQQCKAAGIIVFMVTGDIKETAISIGKEIGLITDADVSRFVITGLEFEQLGEAEMSKKIKVAIAEKKGMIFARTAPRHKKELVKIIKDCNQIVAMTGDGINDAPALQQAHIGIAMGINGDQVAKDNASMILADDNFATIVKAVEEGRGIYENMKAFIRYMISSNVGEVFSIFFSSMLGIPDGFNSIQLLWVNLVTDGVPAMALSFNPPDSDIMIRPPRSKDDGIVDAWIVIRYFTIGIYVGIATVGIFLYWYLGYGWAGDGHQTVDFAKLRNWAECPTWTDFTVTNFDNFDFSKDPCSYFVAGKAKASTLSLSVLVMIEMFNAFNALSENQSLLSTGIMINPYLILAVIGSVGLHCLILYIPSLNFLFATAPLSWNDWMLVIAFSFPVIFLEELLKIVARKKFKDEIALRKKAE